jgi:hypothetical protein
MDSEVNNAFPKRGAASSGIGGPNWIKVRLERKVEWNAEQSSCEKIFNMKEDCPWMTAQHLVDGDKATGC